MTSPLSTGIAQSATNTLYTTSKLSCFICPHCASPLSPDAKTWRCDGSLNDKNTQHPFDVARQGYVNLLPVQSKKSKDPGDSQASIEARHRFLAQGFYDPLEQQITQLITQQPNGGYWLDVGCGEGYYTKKITLNIDRNSKSLTGLIAVDISKPAMALFAKAAKQNQQLWYQVNDHQHSIPIYPIVASAAKLPLKPSSMMGISSIFSPILPAEFANVLQTGGRLLIAKPDIGHLQTLREALFDEVRAHDSAKFLETLAPYFELKNTYKVQTKLSLSKDALANLLTMTPYSYRAKAAKREALLSKSETSEFKTTAKFVVYELVKV